MLLVAHRGFTQAETGRRCLIDQYILEALRRVPGRVGVCPGYTMTATGVGDIIVHGVVDYAFARGLTGIVFATCVYSRSLSADFLPRIARV